MTSSKVVWGCRVWSYLYNGFVIEKLPSLSKQPFSPWVSKGGLRHFQGVKSPAHGGPRTEWEGFRPQKAKSSFPPFGEAEWQTVAMTRDESESPDAEEDCIPHLLHGPTWGPVGNSQLLPGTHSYTVICQERSGEVRNLPELSLVQVPKFWQPEILVGSWVLYGENNILFFNLKIQ